MKTRLLIHGRKADTPAVTEALARIRRRFGVLDLRRIDAPSSVDTLVADALKDGVGRIIVGGGDGTLNLLLNAVMNYPDDARPELALLPLGTANDFARAAAVPADPDGALRLALEGTAVRIDVGRVNERWFLNVASGGFGARITTETPPQLKELLGGAAYALTGLLRLFDFLPVRGVIRIGDLRFEGSAFATAVCNGRQAGGGMLLAPDACLDDGLLDVVIYTPDPLPVPATLAPPTSPLGWLLPLKKIFRAPEVEFIPAEEAFRRINLDGEPYEAERFRFTLHPKALKIVLPDTTPLLGRRS